MAQFFPEFEELVILDSLTDGEIKLLSFFKNNLDDKFEIYYRPFINGDNPTVVLLKQNSGAFIFDVFEHPLTKFEELLTVTENGVFNDFKSPIYKVIEYKHNLYNLHIERLLEFNIKDNRHWKVVNCGIYFNLIPSMDLVKIKHNKYFELIGSDNLNKDDFGKILENNGLLTTSEYFKDIFYKSFLRFLKPPFHKIEDGIEIEYTEKQKKFIESSSGNFLITGFAGSGKTMVLAKRSVNAHIRTKEQVLILTYNKALVNYIHDKINQVKENFSWSSFYIVNYHNFIKTIANNKGLRLHGITAFENEAFFKNCMIKRYKTIIIDEVQDYQPSWLRILKKDFLEENGELVVFGDEKQDIYERKSINKANTGIIFNRSKLNQNQRFSKKINNLLLLYQQYFFANKYDIDKIEIDLNQTINYEEYSEMVDYFNFKGIFNYEMIYKYINDFISKINVHPSDIAILSARVEILIELDFYIRKEKNEKTAVIFERKEIREKLKIDIEEHNKKTADNNKHRNLSEELDKVRDNKKQHFSMDDKVMKLSTIHSFKGWDIHTLFLIIENDVDTKLVTDELIYVGITRCKRNLIILNLGSTKYDNFFSLALKRI